MRMRAAAFVAIGVCIAVVGMAAKDKKDRPAPMPLFITSAGAVDGLTDPSKENRDSVKDVSNILKDDQAFRLVKTAEEARLVLVIQNRNSQATGGFFGGTERGVVLNVILKFQGKEFPLSGKVQSDFDNTRMWRRAASSVSKQVGDWVRENWWTLNPEPSK